MTLLRRFFLCCLLLLSPWQTNAQTVATEFTQASLLSDVSAIQSGKTFWLGVRLVTKDRWHTYWENPGDAGVPTSIEWHLPPGFSAGAIHWPAPVRFESNGIVNFGYEKEALLLVPITPPQTLPEKTSFSFTANANWLVCNDICVPENATLMLNLPSGDTATPGPYAAAIEKARQQLPAPLAKPALFRLTSENLSITLPMEKAQAKKITKAQFFPRQNNIINNAATQSMRVDNGGLTLTTARGSEAAIPAMIDGVVTISSYEGARAFAISAQPVPATESGSTGLLEALLFAILGGLVLNIMPCVLPVLSLKALSISKKAAQQPRAAKLDGLAYTAGILLSFALMSGILISLQQAGKAIGWGYQMQSPVFVACLVYLLFLVGLNLSGVFNLPVLMGGVGGEVTRKDHWLGSFATGVLAVMVATPCTAPFMAPALGYALTQPPLPSFIIFQGLGLGLALPYLLVCFFPPLLRFLPKPGMWMEYFKQTLAFPMYLCAIWLLWVLMQQAGPDAAAYLLLGCVAIVFTVFVWPFVQKCPAPMRWLKIALLLAMIAAPLRWIERQEMPLPPVKSEASAFSMKTLSDLRVQRKPVFVDVTAAWCITCKINERVALNTQTVKDEFARRGITLLVADWTNQDAAITDYLSSFGRKGVPMYVYYPPNGEPKLLPQILTPDTVLEAVR